jgi:hypothetical protein
MVGEEQNVVSLIKICVCVVGVGVEYPGWIKFDFSI